MSAEQSLNPSMPAPHNPSSVSIRVHPWFAFADSRRPTALFIGAICVICGFTLFFFAAAPALAAINLELRPSPGSPSPGGAFAPGDPVNIQLFAVSDTDFDQYLAAAQVILTWDITRLTLLGLTNNPPGSGGATLLVSSFGPEPYGLNTSLADGDAMWLGYAPLGQPVAAHGRACGGVGLRLGSPKLD